MGTATRRPESATGALTAMITNASIQIRCRVAAEARPFNRQTNIENRQAMVGAETPSVKRRKPAFAPRAGSKFMKC